MMMMMMMMMTIQYIVQVNCTDIIVRMNVHEIQAIKRAMKTWHRSSMGNDPLNFCAMFSVDARC